jgi:hypothetical protein
MSFWKRLITGSAPLKKPDLSDRPPEVRMLADLVDGLLENAQVANPPHGLLEACQRIAYLSLDHFCSTLSDAVATGIPCRVGTHDSDGRIYLVFEALPYPARAAIEKLQEISDDPTLGYCALMTNLFLNNWPSPDLQYFFHVIACVDASTQQVNMYSALGKYGGNPKGKHQFYQLPRALMNDEERRLTAGMFREGK